VSPTCHHSRSGGRLVRKHRLAFAAPICFSRRVIATLDLNGTWKLRWADGQRGRMEYHLRDQIDPARCLDAQVPGEIHLDLWRAGRIADPYVGTNCLAARWVEEFLWSYRREFTAPATALKARAWLMFEGLDYAATIFLNGVEIARHANFFHPCRVEVTGKLRRGANLLVVHIESGLFSVADKPLGGLQRVADHALHKAMWLRKPQCQFGWDWSQRLVNVGIHKPVRLEWTADPVRADQFVPLAELSADRQTGTVRARWFVEGFRETRAELTVEMAGRKVTTPVTIKAGLAPIEAQLEITRPKLWWPVGHGSQPRYPVKATLRVAGKIVAERTAKVGFRHVRINQDPHPVKGRSFVVEVNGKPIFCKGGNFVPADMIFQRCDKRRYETLVARALEANFNLLRVWGGGLYESDEFYELCDARGILVWQEFIFACHKYPGTDKAFLDSVRAEATYNVRRLASHPSLIIWCGNNEMEWGAWDWKYDNSDWAYADYALFHHVLPRILAQEDPTRYYQPSSPYSPDKKDNPNADHTGDQHPWSLGFHDTDFRKYRLMECRFPNEGGCLGPTALPTMRACLPPGQQHAQSWAWQVHDNAVDSFTEPSAIDQFTTQWLGKDCRQMTIADYTYWGGLLHGEALGEYIHNFRRRMFDSAAAIFWMYNDCWPATRSWTVVDYYLRRTPAFHPVRRAMQPVTVVVAEQGADIVVFGINETSAPVTADLRYGLLNVAGGYPLDRRAPVTLAANASTPLASFKKSAWKTPRRTIAFALLERDGESLARHRLIRPFFKDLQWPPARVQVKVAAGRATFTSQTFVIGVCLDLDGERHLADNFFDLYPGIPYSIPWQSRTKPRVLYTGNL